MGSSSIDKRRNFFENRWLHCQLTPMILQLKVLSNQSVRSLSVPYLVVISFPRKLILEEKSSLFIKLKTIWSKILSHSLYMMNAFMS